jgi:hypothetical protein
VRVRGKLTPAGSHFGTHPVVQIDQQLTAAGPPHDPAVRGLSCASGLFHAIHCADYRYWKKVCDCYHDRTDHYLNRSNEALEEKPRRRSTSRLIVRVHAVDKIRTAELLVGGSTLAPKLPLESMASVGALLRPDSVLSTEDPPLFVIHCLARYPSKDRLLSGTRRDGHGIEAKRKRAN